MTDTRARTARFVAGALSAAAVVTAAGQEDRVVQIDTLNVRDVLYHLGGGGGNGMALIDEVSADGGVVLIDTKPRGWGAATLEAIGQVTDLPVQTIINTHVHPEHAGSNGEFGDAVAIIAHENAKARMASSGLYAGTAPGLPTTTFTDRYSLLDDLDRIELYYFGPAHTDGDIVVVFPGKGVAYLGDLFPGKMAPTIDVGAGGSGVAFPDTLARVVDEITGVERVITGHGPFPTTYAGRGRREQGAARAWSGFYTWVDLAEYAAFTRDFVGAVTAAYADGQGVAEAVAGLAVGERYAEYDMTDAGMAVAAIYDELDTR